MYDSADEAHAAAQALLQELQRNVVPLEEDCKAVKDQFDSNKKELMTTLVGLPCWYCYYNANIF
jgi:hypothetical protein